MSNRKWTEAQLDAITRNGRNILVSAAAGSGKTAVLTKRIITKLIDENEPADISRMLIVTFTKAAANELKERISTAINEELAKNPSNKRLQKQLVLLDKAKIMTIHSFCYDLIKQNFDKLGMAPSATVSDSIQTSLLMKQVAETIIDSYYSALPEYDDIEDFISFADNFITLKDDNLSNIFLSVYNKILSFPRGIEHLADTVAEFDKILKGNIYSSVWGNIVIERLKDILSYYKVVFSDAVDYFNDGDLFQEKYLPSFEYELNYSKKLLSLLCSEDINEIKNVFSEHSAVPLKQLKSEFQTAQCLFYRDARKNFEKELAKFAENYFSQSDEIIKKTALKSKDYVNKLYLFLKSFDKRYRYEKKKRNILDFSDLERLTFNLLTDSNGKPNEFSRSISLAYDEIYIDEYQDVNSLQDMIFTAISGNSSRFMVGDIKQSIYGFRGAEPSLFASYRKNENVDKIYLSHNFRCDKSIIDFVNLVCGKLFLSAGKTVPYDKSDELIYGKDNGENHQIEIGLIDSGKSKAQEKRELEANFVASKINKLINEGACKPKDICILLRSARSCAEFYETSLKKLNIPCKNQLQKELFENPEILLVMNLLNIIDNPTRDIYLAGALKSPVFNFSLDDLVLIRNYTPSGSLFSALKKYTSDFDFEKGKAFLSKLKYYRSMASQPVDKLIWFLYRDTLIFSLATGGNDSSNANEKKHNLLMFYEYARNFEKGEYKGLYRFIQYLNDILQSGAGIEAPPSLNESDNYVRIMTIHQSKGLEFHTVFLCDCASDFSDSDLKEKILIDKNLGTTLKLADDSGLATYDTVMRKAEALGLKMKNLDEETRVLYVAMTRAVHRLIITAALPEPKSFVERCAYYAKYQDIANGFVVKNAANYIEWIIMSSVDFCHPEIIIPSEKLDEKIENESSVLLNDLKNEDKHDSSKINNLVSEFSNRFDFVYPHIASKIPSKLSVSELYPSVLDENDDSLKLNISENNMHVPNFIRDMTKNAAAIGTATHQFMQFCDYSLMSKNGIEEEISRLLKNGYIDSHTAELIERKSIVGFLSSEIFEKLKKASLIRREFRFNVRLPASIFTVDKTNKETLKSETVLVQGIMDCVFIDSDGYLSILDYKTDRIPYEYKASNTAEQYLIDRHFNQLSYYKLACELTMCRKVDKVLIYSFDLQKTIEIPKEMF